MSDDSYSDDSFEDSQDLSADAVPRKPEPEDVGSETETPGSASTSKFSPLRANAASSLPSPPPQQSDAQVISRLKVSNTKLRNQLTEFNEILRNTLKDASLKGAGKGAGTGAGSGSPPEKTAPHAFIQLKETQIKAARKKAEVYRRANNDLKRRLARVQDDNLVARLENNVKERDIRITQLREENRTLKGVTRQQGKIIVEQGVDQEEWPAKVSKLQEEIRVGREKLRQHREREVDDQERAQRQEDHVGELEDRNRELLEALRGGMGRGDPAWERKSAEGKSAGSCSPAPIEARGVSERGVGGGVGGGAEGGGMPTAPPTDGVDELKQEKQDLQSKLALMEKVQGQARKRLENALKTANDETLLERVVVADLQQQLSIVDKQMRLQLVEVNQMKRFVRDLAAGKTQEGADVDDADAGAAGGRGRGGRGTRGGGPGVGAGGGAGVGVGAGGGSRGQRIAAAAQVKVFKKNERGGRGGVSGSTSGTRGESPARREASRPVPKRPQGTSRVRPGGNTASPATGRRVVREPGKRGEAATKRNAILNGNGKGSKAKSKAGRRTRAADGGGRFIGSAAMLRSLAADMCAFAHEVSGKEELGVDRVALRMDKDRDTAKRLKREVRDLAKQSMEQENPTLWTEVDRGTITYGVLYH